MVLNICFSAHCSYIVFIYWLLCTVLPVHILCSYIGFCALAVPPVDIYMNTIYCVHIWTIYILALVWTPVHIVWSADLVLQSASVVSIQYSPIIIIIIIINFIIIILFIICILILIIILIILIKMMRCWQVYSPGASPDQDSPGNLHFIQAQR